MADWEDRAKTVLTSGNHLDRPLHLIEDLPSPLLQASVSPLATPLGGSAQAIACKWLGVEDATSLLGQARLRPWQPLGLHPGFSHSLPDSATRSSRPARVLTTAPLYLSMSTRPSWRLPLHFRSHLWAPTSATLLPRATHMRRVAVPTAHARWSPPPPAHA